MDLSRSDIKLSKYRDILNNLHAVFPVLLTRLSNRFTLPEWVLKSLTSGKLEAIIDTMPIIMAQGSRSYTAKVAFDISHI